MIRNATRTRASAVVLGALLLMLGGAVLNVGLSVPLGKTFGLSGIAWGTTVPLLLVTPAIAIYLCRVLGMSVANYLVRAVCLPATAAAPVWAASTAVTRLIIPSSYPLLAASCFAAAAVHSGPP